jgi:hypothetical protein
MKKLLTLAAIVAAFALAQAPAFAAEAAPAAKTEATAAPMKKAAAKVTKAEIADCKKESKAEKDGKKPSGKEAAAAYQACVKAKTDTKKGADAAPATEAPKIEEKK